MRCRGKCNGCKLGCLQRHGYLLINNFALASSVNPRQICYCGGIGRHKGLKIPRNKVRIGSSPISSTIQDFVKVVIIVHEALETYSIGSPLLLLIAYSLLALVYFICKDLNKVTDILTLSHGYHVCRIRSFSSCVQVLFAC